MNGKPQSHSIKCSLANVHVIAIIDLTLHKGTETNACTVSVINNIILLCSYIHYLGCLMFRCLLCRRRLGMRLMYIQAQ